MIEHPLFWHFFWVAAGWTAVGGTITMVVALVNAVYAEEA